MENFDLPVLLNTIFAVLTIEEIYSIMLLVINIVYVVIRVIEFAKGKKSSEEVIKDLEKQLENLKKEHDKNDK